MQLRGLSQAEVARRLRTPQKPNGVSGVAVGHWLHGDTRPRQISAEVFAEVLQVHPNEVRTALGLEPSAPTEANAGLASQRRLSDVIGRISARDLDELCDFAEFLALRRERETWGQYGLEILARAYGDDEPEYTLADVKR
jgi:transcriptional regulator with XRE-family HTH domain